MRIPVIQTKLIVVPDPTTMGSEGLRANLMVVTLCEPTEDIPPVLPPFQPSIFPGLAR
jgi:hypothetical protein